MCLFSENFPTFNAHHDCLAQSRNQLGTPGGRRVFWVGLKFSIFSNYIQQIFSGGASPPMVTGLVWSCGF